MSALLAKAGTLDYSRRQLLAKAVMASSRVAVSCGTALLPVSPRPFRRKPGRLSRVYRFQEEGLERVPRGYRPTIVVLRRDRLGTGEFRRRPFRTPHNALTESEGAGNVANMKGCGPHWALRLRHVQFGVHESGELRDASAISVPTTIINPSLRLLRSVLINRDCSAIGCLPPRVSNRF
jgi:hypothetical protein